MTGKITIEIDSAVLRDGDPVEALARWLLAALESRQPGKAVMTTEEAASYLGLSPATLETWRSRGGGPKYIPLGRKKRGWIRYRKQHLDEWLDSRAVEHTR